MSVYSVSSASSSEDLIDLLGSYVVFPTPESLPEPNLDTWSLKHQCIYNPHIRARPFICILTTHSQPTLSLWPSCLLFNKPISIMSFGSPCSAPSSPILLGHPSWSALLDHDSGKKKMQWNKVYEGPTYPLDIECVAVETWPKGVPTRKRVGDWTAAECKLLLDNDVAFKRIRETSQ
ncbi:hypothetical protein [Absidia glauca]|uniref:Uncharacterized protein n=1 Tax=Absidia glauca TaxID=4829 RepID=A0A163LT47_ABSGL|nr:hypothetical protein [Absidia glauca]